MKMPKYQPLFEGEDGGGPTIPFIQSSPQMGKWMENETLNGIPGVPPPPVPF